MPLNDMVKRNQNSNHNPGMTPITYKTSPNFKAFHDLTPDFLFGFIAPLLSLLYPRLQKVPYFSKGTSLILPHL